MTTVFFCFFLCIFVPVKGLNKKFICVVYIKIPDFSATCYLDKKKRKKVAVEL